MSEITSLYLHQNKYFLLLCILFSTPIAGYIKNITQNYLNKSSKQKILSIYIDLSVSAMYIILFVVNISYIVKNTYNPFIYFNF